MHRNLSKLKQIKYPLIISILGMLICASIIWNVFGIQGGYHPGTWTTPDGSLSRHEFDLQVRLWRNAVWPGVCFLLGLSLFITGIVHAIIIGRQVKFGKAISDHNNFLLAYFIMGAIFVGAMILYIGWLEPHWKSIPPFVMPDGRKLFPYFSPTWIRALIAWEICSFALGAAIIGLEIIQLRLVRR